jgi:NAD(P)H-dependent nitrite reductase small subunit
VFAISNYDPFGHANVLSRGMIGDIKGEPMVASPLYKQHFSLKTGVCLEDEQVKIDVYPIRINEQRVEVSIEGA